MGRCNLTPATKYLKRLYVREQKRAEGSHRNCQQLLGRKHGMSDYDVNLDDEWQDEQVLWHFDEELVVEAVDEDCELWGFSLLEDEEAA